jgi:hypothetical protein
MRSAEQIIGADGLRCVGVPENKIAIEKPSMFAASQKIIAPSPRWPTGIMVIAAASVTDDTYIHIHA